VVRINDPLSGSDLLSRKLLEVSIHIGSDRSSEVDRRDFGHVEITQGVVKSPKKRFNCSCCLARIFRISVWTAWQKMVE
jgi:hypothetical protein